MIFVTHNGDVSPLLLLPGAELPSWKFSPSQRPLSTSLDPGRRLSSFWSSFGRCPVWCYPPICRGFQLNIFLTVLVSGILCTWPNQLSLWASMWLIIFLCFISLSNFSLVLTLHDVSPQSYKMSVGSGPVHWHIIFVLWMKQVAYRLLFVHRCPSEYQYCCSPHCCIINRQHKEIWETWYFWYVNFIMQPNMCGVWWHMSL